MRSQVSASKDVVASILTDPRECVDGLARAIDPEWVVPSAMRWLFEHALAHRDEIAEFGPGDGPMVARRLYELAGESWRGPPALELPRLCEECVPNGQRWRVYALELEEAARVRAIRESPPDLGEIRQVAAELEARRESLELPDERGDRWSSVVTSADLESEPFERPRDILGDGLLVAGVWGLIAARPGMGKSWAALQLAHCAAVGRPWLGLEVRQSRTLYVGMEMQGYHLQERHRTIVELDSGLEGTGDRLRMLPRHTPPLRLTDPGEVRDLISHLTEHGTELLILDPLSRLHKSDENDAREIGWVLDAIHRICDETGVAALLVHHERKGAERKRGDGHQAADMDSVRGSSRLTSDPNLILRIVSADDGTWWLRCPKTNFGKGPKPIQIEPRERGGWQRAVLEWAPNERRSDGLTRDQAVYDFLRQHGPATRREIDRACSLSEDQTRRALRAIGSIKVDGKYALNVPKALPYGCELDG